MERRLTTAGRGGSDVELSVVDEREGAAVGGHSDHQLLLRSALAHPLAS